MSATPKLKEASVLPGIEYSLENPGDWSICVGQHRDSDLVERSNFIAAERTLETADPMGLDHQTLRFGHWAVGWVEEMIVRKGTKCWEVACEIRAALDSYPLLDESLHSEMEFEEHEAGECGEDCGLCEAEKYSR